MRSARSVALALCVATACAGLGTQATPRPQLPATAAAADARSVRATYSKREHAVAMRDGVRLHTAVYTPRECAPGGHPIMLQRTPYGVAPYGKDAYRRSLGPSRLFQDDGFIFVYQDVRGRYMSEGIWEEERIDRHLGHRRLAAATRALPQRSRGHVGHLVSRFLRVERDD
jgi:hypothetical protein